MGSNRGEIELFNLPVSVSMRRRVVTVSPVEPVSSLMFRMVDNDIGAVIVIEKGRPTGIITEKDVLQRVIGNDKNVYRTRAQDVMSTPIITIEKSRPIKEALKLMQNHQIRRLVVMENDALVGLVTERRLLETIVSKVV